MGKSLNTNGVARRWLVVLGIALVCAAAGMLGHRFVTSAMAGKTTDGILAQLTARMPQSYKAPSTSKIKPKDVGMPVLDVQGFNYVGTIAIPTLGLDLPVCANLDNERLLLSPCCYAGSYITDDLIICGEGYSSHFGNIQSVGIKDEVRLVTVDGTLYRYIVSNVETDRLQDIDKIYDDWDLALFTFNADDTVCVVRCIRSQ